MSELLIPPCETAIPLHLVFEAAEGAEPPVLPPFARAVGFRPSAGRICLLPSAGGDGLAGVLVGMGNGRDPFVAGDLATSLPAGDYVLGEQSAWALGLEETTAFARSWVLGAYSLDRYKGKAAGGQNGDAKDSAAREKGPARLVWPASVDRAGLLAMVRAVTLVRDLINTPANDMGPQQIEDAAHALAAEFSASLHCVRGEELLAANYPAVYAVGQGAARAPRLLDLRWGKDSDPRVTVVGKGVVFDSGGLDIKPASAMRLMKKDMGGAAHALGTALLVMAAGLPVRLRVLLPVVENAVSATAMRPGDILQTRKGLTVEVSNTDAEGRLILADALAEGDSEQPALLVDFATLTGAARVALGPDLPALFSNDDALAADLLASGQEHHDPLWRLPLWEGYRSQVESRIADLDNAPEGGMAGAITAALFLQRFVSASTPWAHIDTYGWNGKARPGRPAGGEALGMRAVFDMLRKRFAPPAGLDCPDSPEEDNPEDSPQVVPPGNDDGEQGGNPQG